MDATHGRRGLFVVLEGPDGAGKSQAAATLVERLVAAGHDVVATREPGGTRLGESLRQVLLHAGAVARTPVADALLFNAARSQLVNELIGPALDRGAIVVSDRYATSTMAYQGFGSGVDLRQLRELETLATGGLEPDLVILLDVPIEVGLGRKDPGDRRETRFEEQFDRAYHERVRTGYRTMADADPKRWKLIDGTASGAVVADQVVELVERHLTASEPMAVGSRITA